MSPLHEDEPIYFLNGKYIPASKATISLLDLGLMRGVSVFEYLRTYGAHPFYLKAHLERFEKSVSYMGLKLPLPLSEIAKVINALLEKNTYEEYGIKLLLTGGVEGRQNFGIIIFPYEPYPETHFTEGVRLKSMTFQRPLPYCKSTHYFPALLNLSKAEDVFEILYLTENKQLLECSTSNIFLVKENHLITPAKHILKGITRNIILDLARADFIIEERDVNYDELFSCDDVFITATNKEVMPIVNVDGISIAKETVGNATKKLQQLFSQILTHTSV